MDLVKIYFEYIGCILLLVGKVIDVNHKDKDSNNNVIIRVFFRLLFNRAVHGSKDKR
jgi:hypothetical protein